MAAKTTRSGGTRKRDGAFAMKMSSPRAHPVKAATVKFGSVTVSAAGPTRTVKIRNIKAGQAALARGLAAMASPGIKLQLKKGTPIFQADPEHPGQLIRKLNGKVERGRFEDGIFKARA